MSRDVPWSEKNTCDGCGAMGAYDFMGDCFCDDCIARMDEEPIDVIDVTELQQLLVETQKRCDELGRDNQDLRASSRQLTQALEEAREALRHYQQAARGMGPVERPTGGAWVGGQMVDIA